jgi:uncharacterized protein YhfF
MYEVCLIAWIYEVELQAEVDWCSRCCDLNSMDKRLALVDVVLKGRKRKNCSVWVFYIESQSRYSDNSQQFSSY